jgi:hypothetical protein
LNLEAFFKWGAFFAAVTAKNRALRGFRPFSNKIHALHGFYYCRDWLPLRVSHPSNPIAHSRTNRLMSFAQAKLPSRSGAVPPGQNHEAADRSFSGWTT